MARVLVSNTSITGEVKVFAGSVAPDGYLLCQGQAVSRTVYSGLFSVIGTDYGVGDGLTTFNLPDCRGIFIRGVGSQVVGGITYSGTLAGKQNDKMQSHKHTDSGHQHNFQWYFDPPITGLTSALLPGGELSKAGMNANNNSPNRTATNAVVSGTSNISAPSIDGVNGTPRTGTETNPVNIAMNYIIKV